MHGTFPTTGGNPNPTPPAASALGPAAGAVSANSGSASSTTGTPARAPRAGEDPRTKAYVEG